jgi:polysaccharide export outer membrane protein
MTGAFAKRLDTGDPVDRPEDLPDEDLLEQFLYGEVLESQDAFRALVVRHGPTVLAICRRVLDRDHGAEDASQATFLALAKKGASISDRRALAGWLREVAFRIALRMRTRASRRKTVERRVMAMAAAQAEPGEPDWILSLSDLRPILHEEVVRLPEKYRSPVVLS